MYLVLKETTKVLLSLFNAYFLSNLSSLVPCIATYNYKMGHSIFKLNLVLKNALPRLMTKSIRVLQFLSSSRTNGFPTTIRRDFALVVATLNLSKVNKDLNLIQFYFLLLPFWTVQETYLVLEAFVS